ncbi:hypothetical protein CGLO_15141 [Colletotrichum gloeosporioides Cg-14]|uniref:Biogenesis of lysosome-related organelles complex 1 subunit CNL1 n=1 Tax=Colletotrichum gloeosporioides (strain Cg-14) TaxID=1237896 RepID=T0L2N7_COLGC|nr:hypothetical protein CGLO_15141 [Colletotrichum gloeosporioides Cg-14]
MSTTHTNAVPDSQLGLSYEEVQLLRQGQAALGQGAGGGGSNSSRAASRASSQGLLLLDSTSLAALGRYFDRVMNQIEQQIIYLSEQSQMFTMAQFDRAGNLIEGADAEIQRYHEILRQLDELELDFDRIRHIKEIVLVAFFMPAFLSNAVLGVAYLSRTLPDNMYAHFDEKFVSRLNSTLKSWKRLWNFLEKPPKTWTWMRMVRYEALLLTISDQVLVASLVILIAMYAQICSISNLTFSVAVTLSYFATGVHALTLVALKGYFAGHQTQARIRLGSMVFITVFQIASVFLFKIAEQGYLSNHVVCDIKDPNVDWAHTMWSSLAERWFISYGLYNAMFSIWEPHSQYCPVNAWVLGLLRLSYRDENCRVDRDELVIQEGRRLGQSRARHIHKLQQHPDAILTKLRIIVPVIAIDFSTSTFWTISGSVFFTLWTTEMFVEMLFYGRYESIDVKSLLEPKFGQLLPILLLLVFVFSFMEASGTPNLTTDVPPGCKSQTSDTNSMLDNDIGVSGGPRSSEDSLNEVPKLNQGQAVAVEASSTREQYATYVRLETTDAQIDHTPAANSTDLNRLIELQARTDTFGQEAGRLELASFEELMEAIYTKAPKYSRVFVLATLAAQLCFFVALFFFFNPTVTALFCLKTLVVLKRMVVGFRGFRRKMSSDKNK